MRQISHQFYIIFCISFAALAGGACGESSSQPQRQEAGGNKQNLGDKNSRSQSQKDSRDSDSKPSQKSSQSEDEASPQKKSNFESHDRKAISFRGIEGDKVPGYLWFPDSDGKVPFVLLMYGIGGDKDNGDIGEAAMLLAQAGIAAMTIDWIGTGDRGDIGNDDRILNAAVLDQTVGDYQKAFDFVLDKYGDRIDEDKLGFGGASMGAMTGLNFLAADNRVAASVSIVPIINPLWGNKDPAEKIKVVQHPHLCIYSTGPTRAVEQAVCDNGRGNVTKKSLEGGHELENVREQAAEEILDFFLEQFDEHR